MPRNPHTVRFDVGGKVYRVSRSLVEKFPDTALARSIAAKARRDQDQGQDRDRCRKGGDDCDDRGDDVDDVEKAREAFDEGPVADGRDDDDDEPIFLERDGERFRYVLDYMRDGRVDLPPTVPRAAILRDLNYLGFVGVGPSSVVGGAGAVEGDEVARGTDGVGASGGTDSKALVDTMEEDDDEDERINNDCDVIMKFFVMDLMQDERMARHLDTRGLGWRGRYSGRIAMSFLPRVDGEGESYDLYEAANRVFADESGEERLNERFSRYGLQIERKERLAHGSFNAAKVTYWRIYLRRTCGCCGLRCSPWNQHRCCDRKEPSYDYWCSGFGRAFDCCLCRSLACVQPSVCCY